MVQEILDKHIGEVDMSMTWLWETFEAYKNRVAPIEATMPTFLEAALHHDTAAQVWEQMVGAIHELSVSADELAHFKIFERHTLSSDQGKALIDAITEAVLHGEHLLGYNRRLAETGAGTEFIDAKHVARDPDRYLQDGRLLRKALALSRASHELIGEWHRQQQGDALFLLTGA